MNKYVSLDKRSKKAKRRSAKNSEMDLMPIFFGLFFAKLWSFFVKIYIFA